MSMPSTSAPPSRASLLRSTLLANAAVSSTLGLSFVLFAERISRFLGWSALWVVPLIGASLLAFAALMVWSARTPPNAPLVWVIIAADLAWVALSLLFLAAPLVPLTAAGRWAAGILAAVVAAFALLQFLGLRRAKR